MTPNDLLTDEEFLDATGIPSVPSLKKVLTTKLVLPIYKPLPGGGRERRWSKDQVSLVRLVTRLADAMGTSLQTAADMLRGLDPRWCDDNCDGEIRRLLVGDRVHVWIERYPGIFQRLRTEGEESNIDRLTKGYCEVCVLKVDGKRISE